MLVNQKPFRGSKSLYNRLYSEVETYLGDVRKVIGNVQDYVEKLLGEDYSIVKFERYNRSAVPNKSALFWTKAYTTKNKTKKYTNVRR